MVNSLLESKNDEKIQIQQLITKNCDLNIISNQELQKLILKKRRAEDCSLEFEEKMMTCYKKRARILEEVPVFKKIKTELNEIICPVCMDLIISSTITSCGHTFCERCLSEALNLSPV